MRIRAVSDIPNSGEFGYGLLARVFSRQKILHGVYPGRHRDRLERGSSHRRRPRLGAYYRTRPRNPTGSRPTARSVSRFPVSAAPNRPATKKLDNLHPTRPRNPSSISHVVLASHADRLATAGQSSQRPGCRTSLQPDDTRCHPQTRAIRRNDARPPKGNASPRIRFRRPLYPRFDSSATAFGGRQFRACWKNRDLVETGRWGSPETCRVNYLLPRRESFSSFCGD